MTARHQREQIPAPALVRVRHVTNSLKVKSKDATSLGSHSGVTGSGLRRIVFCHRRCAKGSPSAIPLFLQILARVAVERAEMPVRAASSSTTNPILTRLEPV